MDLKSNNQNDVREIWGKVTKITQTSVSKAKIGIIRHFEGHETTWELKTFTIHVRIDRKAAEHNDFMSSVDNEWEEWQGNLFTGALALRTATPQMKITSLNYAEVTRYAGLFIPKLVFICAKTNQLYFLLSERKGHERRRRGSFNTRDTRETRD